MPKKAMKIASSWRSCPPKKGKQRMAGKKIGDKKKNPRTAKVKYTRFGHAVQKSRQDRAKWRRSIKDLIKASDLQIVSMLISDGILPKMKDTLCPGCNKGKLGSLKSSAGESLHHRCSYFKCQKRVLPHHDHPIFTTGGGQDYVPLQDQAATLLCAVSNVKQTATRLLLHRNHKFTENLYHRVDAMRAQFVEKKQAKIKFGVTDPWPDVEADEVDLRRKFSADVPADSAVEWEQWGGVVERGRPETLVLTRLNPKKTAKRAPGPGAMRRTDWEPFARRRLQNKKVILHTDGARAYRLRMPGVLHDNVVHMKKQMLVDGKWVWIKPAFAKVVEHILPDSKKKIRVMAGTQVIDRLWRHVRSFLEGRTAPVGSKMLRQRIRSAQYTYWYRGQDLWLETGLTLKSMRD
jgi:hypothetical protein